MTGVAADTIRAWERRYGAVEPRRTPTRNRLYSKTDIARLALIKRLVDAGDRVGSVAHLSIEALQARLEAHQLPRAMTDGSMTRPRVAILGDALPAQLGQGAFMMDGFEIVGVHRERTRFRQEVSRLHPDEIVLEYPTLHAHDVREIHSLLETAKAVHACVIYGFAPQRVVRALDTVTITPLRAPVDLAELRQVILAGASARPLSTPVKGPSPQTTLAESLPARRYDDETLNRIVKLAAPVQCECPHHLVDIIRSLAAFESYSSECENRNADEAALHAYLHATTAQARAAFEEALEKVARADGLELEVGPAYPGRPAKKPRKSA